VNIRVEAVAEHGMATIWDADIFIWAASQIVEARDVGLRPSRLMATTPYEILNFIGRGVSLRDYDRLKAALDRLQSTTVATSIRQPLAAQTFRLRPARYRPPPAAAGLPAHRAMPRRSGNPLLRTDRPRRARHSAPPSPLDNSPWG